jgi:hypothetical protein
MTLFKKLNLNLSSKKVTKMSAAIALSLAGAISSMSAIAMATDSTKLHQEVREISIESEQGKEVKLFVHENGEMVNVTIPHSALKDAEQISHYLADVPDGLKEKLLEELTNLSSNEHTIASKGSRGEIMHWVTEGESENVIVIEANSDEDADIKKHIIKEVMTGDHHKMIKFEHFGEMGVNSIINMLKHGDFSVEELNEIQQALDVKR